MFEERKRKNLIEALPSKTWAQLRIAQSVQFSQSAQASLRNQKNIMPSKEMSFFLLRLIEAVSLFWKSDWGSIIEFISLQEEPFKNGNVAWDIKGWNWQLCERNRKQAKWIQPWELFSDVSSGFSRENVGHSLCFSKKWPVVSEILHIWVRLHLEAWFNLSTLTLSLKF